MAQSEKLNAESGLSGTSAPPSDLSGGSRVFAASAPTIPARISSAVSVKQQASAPCYLLSLSENPAPPFRRPGKEARPRLLVGAVMSEREAVEMVAAGEEERDGMRKYINKFIVDKKITDNFNLSERRFLVGLVREAADYAAQREFSALKLALLVTLYLDTHSYFKWYYWSEARAVWQYFMENLIRHTIEDSPDGHEVFEPEESYDILTHFHAAYLNNLPLVHVLGFGAHRLKITWPYPLHK